MIYDIVGRRDDCGPVMELNLGYLYLYSQPFSLNYGFFCCVYGGLRLRVIGRIGVLWLCI